MSARECPRAPGAELRGVPAQFHHARHLLAGRAYPAGRPAPLRPDPDLDPARSGSGDPSAGDPGAGDPVARGASDPASTRLAIFRRRILLAQALYALAALICLASNVASVIALALVQLHFIVSPRLFRRAGDPGREPDDG